MAAKRKSKAKATKRKTTKAKKFSMWPK